jgi:3'-5' exoribonuclease
MPDINRPLSPSCIAEIRDNDVFSSVLLIVAAEKRVTAAGKSYLDMTLSDASGSINAKFWDGTRDVPPAGYVMDVRAVGNNYNGRMQLRIEKFNVRTPTDADMKKLVASAPEDPDDMLLEITRAADQIRDNDIRLITCRLLEKAGPNLRTFPAAKQMHHAYRSGLLYHTVTLLRLARAILGVYPHLNSSLLIGGAIIHDLAKITEMDAGDKGVVSDYTVDGKLIGHLVRMVTEIEIVSRELKVAPEKAVLLEHMILSHHGQPDYGSPKPPMFPEAEVLHAIDNLDAHLAAMQDAVLRSDEGGFSERQWGLDNRQIFRIPQGLIEG